MTETQHPVISVVVTNTDGRVELPDRIVSLTPASASVMVNEAVRILLEHVREVGRPVDVSVRESNTIEYLRVGTDGTIVTTGRASADQHDVPAMRDTVAVHSPAQQAQAAAPAHDREEDHLSLDTAEFEAVLAAAPAIGTAPSPTSVDIAGESTSASPVPPTPSSAKIDTESYTSMTRERRSFIDKDRIEKPARTGIRGTLGRVGIKIAPSATERAEREDRNAVAQHWPGKRTIAIVNGKGGAGKTPTTICLSAIFAHHGGAGVVAWDNNQNRGTLGWRTEQGPHDATLLDLRDQAKELLSPRAEAADIAKYVHHQPDDKFDVLRSQPMMLRDEQRLGVIDFKAIHKVLGKYYRLIFVDSGNDESDPLWGRMIDHADQIVVATSTRGDIAEAGALLLEALGQRDEHSAALARNAVVVVSQANQHAPTSEAQDIALEFSHVARETISIPYDRGMADGLLQLSNLRPATRRAWLSAAAALGRGL